MDGAAKRSRTAEKRACRSRSAALNAVRRRFTASAPGLRPALLCHARRLRIRRIGISRNRPGSGETVAPQKWRGVKANNGLGPALREAGRPRSLKMDTCVMCRRKVERAENWIKCHLWGGFAIFHWRCFGEYLRAESEEQVESAVWKASSNA